jgi:Tfp pilus assembly protein PilO
MTDLRRIVGENRRVIWILAAALVLNAVLYALVVSPFAQRVQTEQQQAGEATRALTAARRTFNAAQGTVSGKKQTDEELEKFYRDVLARDLSTARRIFYPHVEQLARKMNLTSTSRWSPQADRKTGLSKLTVTLRLTGDYTGIRRFIHELETAPEFIVLEGVTVTQGGEGEHELDVTALVATYYRSEANGN